MPYGKKSPAKMGHKDSAMKMGHSPMKKESAKQERKNLMDDMPVDKRASAMQMGHSPLEGHCMGSPAKMGHESPVKMAGSWMSKHSKSALHMGHSPAEMGHDSPAEMHGGFHPGDAAKAFAGAAIKTAKKVKDAGKKIAKAVSADLFEGGSERKRKLRAARGGAQPAKVFKK